MAKPSYRKQFRGFVVEYDESSDTPFVSNQNLSASLACALDTGTLNDGDEWIVLSTPTRKFLQQCAKELEELNLY